MAVEKYMDFYSCTATIRSGPKGYRLVVKGPSGRTIRSQLFKTHRGAVRAMNNDSDSTMERVN